MEIENIFKKILKFVKVFIEEGKNYIFNDVSL